MQFNTQMKLCAIKSIQSTELKIFVTHSRLVAESTATAYFDVKSRKLSSQQSMAYIMIALMFEQWNFDWRSKMLNYFLFVFVSCSGIDWIWIQIVCVSPSRTFTSPSPSSSSWSARCGFLYNIWRYYDAVTSCRFGCGFFDRHWCVYTNTHFSFVVVKSENHNNNRLYTNFLRHSHIALIFLAQFFSVDLLQ